MTPRPSGAAPIYQVVASPLRNKLEPDQAFTLRACLTPAARLVTWPLARAAGVPRPPAGWRLTHGPWFENHLADLSLGRRHAELAVREAQPGRHPEIRTRLLLRLSPRAN